MNTIDINALSPEQLATLSKQMKAARKTVLGVAEARNVVIDAMLATREGADWKHTTGEILAALQGKGILPTVLSSTDRAIALKMIQTRKQHLVKKDGCAEKYGFKASATGFNLTPERVIEWCKTSATKEQMASIFNAVCHLFPTATATKKK